MSTRRFAYLLLGLLIGTTFVSFLQNAKKVHTAIEASPSPTPTTAPLTPSVEPAISALSPTVSTTIASPTPSSITPAPSPSHVMVTPTHTPTSPTPEPAPTATTSPTQAPSETVIKRATPVDANVIVLGYHQFSGPGTKPTNIYMMAADTFEWEMKYLKENGYTVVTLADLEKFLRKEILLPRRSVVITLDDGYRSVYTWAYPILKKYGYPSTFFVYTDYVNSGGGSITWDQLREMQTNGMDIQSHSKSHPLLTRKRAKTDEQYEAWLHDEIVTSKGIIEKEMGHPVIRFAYPFGDWNKHVEQRVLEGGFASIYTVAGNPVTQATQLKSVGRFIITRQNEKSFTAYLNQIALGLIEMTPAPGDTVEDARPTIKVRLAYAGVIDPKSIEVEASGFGRLPVDFDPATQTVRAYLQRDLVQRVLRVEVRLRDAETKRIHQSSWQFNFGKKNDALTADEQMMAPPTPAARR